MSPRLPTAYADAYEATAMALHDTAACECLYPIVTHGPETEAVLSALGPNLRDRAAKLDECRSRVHAVLALCDRWAADGPGDVVSITAVRAMLGFPRPEPAPDLGPDAAVWRPPVPSAVSVGDLHEHLDPGTATRAALGEEIERLRLQLVERNDAVQFMTRMRDKAEMQRDAARRDLAETTTLNSVVTRLIAHLAAATATLQRIRELCDEAEYVRLAVDEPDDVPPALAVAVSDILVALDAAGDGAMEATPE